MTDTPAPRTEAKKHYIPCFPGCIHWAAAPSEPPDLSDPHEAIDQASAFGRGYRTGLRAAARSGYDTAYLATANDPDWAAPSEPPRPDSGSWGHSEMRDDIRGRIVDEQMARNPGHKHVWRCDYCEAHAAAPSERFDRSWWHYADDCPAAPSGQPLDVERLARAFINQRSYVVTYPSGWRDSDLRWFARQVAADYARLAESLESDDATD